MKTVVIFLISVYRRVCDVLAACGFPPSSCRFHPTCSYYMEEAINKYGVVRGIRMGLARIGRCHPLFKGGYDPVR